MTITTTTNVKIASDAVEKILSTISAEDAATVLKSLKASKPQLTGRAAMVERLAATGRTQDHLKFIERAWASAERIGLKVDEESGMIVGGLAAVDAAFREPHVRAQMGGDDVGFRIRTKSVLKQAGLI